MSADGERKVALVTGASRGIGKACAVRLARAGFDVAVTARTVSGGERRDHSPTVQAIDDRPLPGSLSETASLVEAEGQQAMMVPADLLDLDGVTAAAQAVVDGWGRVDVLVNNGRFIGPGMMDKFLDTPLDLFEKPLRANVLAPLALMKVVVPGMIDRGSGTIVNITSSAAFGDPTKRIGEGGWGMNYGVSKGGLHRVAGYLNLEYGDAGIRCFNVHPGYVINERVELAAAEGGNGRSGGAPPDVVGAVVAWLVTEPLANEYVGVTVEAQFVCHELGLVPEWDGPAGGPATVHDPSMEALQRHEEIRRAQA